MAPSELLTRLVQLLDSLQVGYLVTGSMASISYGEPRFTNDIDVVVELRAEHVDRFCAAFPSPEYYVSADAAKDAVRNRRMFNVIHTSSGLKIDVIIPADTDFERSRRKRRRLVLVAPGLEFHFASPEDVILRKLEAYHEGGSEKHLRDIAGVLKIQGQAIDRTYIAEWAARLGVAQIWEQVLKRLDNPTTNV
jgi:hypothetical protein